MRHEPPLAPRIPLSPRPHAAPLPGVPAPLRSCSAKLAPPSRPRYSSSPSPALPRDAYEPNDTCVAPPAVLNGVTPNLTLGPDPDDFAIDVPVNARIVIEARSTAPGTAMYDV